MRSNSISRKAVSNTAVDYTEGSTVHFCETEPLSTYLFSFVAYDLIILPDFQYGGMEHTGATLYNDRRMFLSTHPTTDELLGRASLIAHETAHMWFGDYVTMKWFDDELCRIRRPLGRKERLVLPIPSSGTGFSRHS